jgi:hypothetical protein
MGASAMVIGLSGFVNLAVSSARRGRFQILFLKLAIVAVPVVLTLSASKAPDYLIPLLFIMLLIVGEFVRDLFSDPQKVTRLEKTLCRINIVIVVAGLIIALIGLAVYFRQPVLFGLAPLIALAFACLARRVWSEWLRWRSVLRFHLVGHSCYVVNDSRGFSNPQRQE